MYIGLPQWHHAKWAGLGIRSLDDYAQLFNCVEGNTTFYALPDAASVRRWRDMTSENFRFCFKFPSAISHQAALTQCDALRDDFFRCMSHLGDRIGQYWLQLPARFAPDDLPLLWRFLDTLPCDYHYGVEVRHPAFFAKGDAEQALNRGLHAREINRVILDSRAVHMAAGNSPALSEARGKKPRVPVHAIATAQQPMTRFIASDDPVESLALFAVWIDKLSAWQSHGYNPYLFIHTPDMGEVNQFIHSLWPLLTLHFPTLSTTPPFVCQPALF